MSAVPTPPVIVISPALRAGTTLLQRLLCSASNTLIYGDLTGQELDFLAKYAFSRQQMLAHHESLAGPQREVVRSGGTDEFLTALTPAPTMQHRQWRDAALAWMGGCEEDAAAQGRPVWGWKLAGADGFAFATLAAWLPEARWIFIRRQVADCFRSAKAAGLVDGVDDARKFFQQAEQSDRMWRAAPIAHRLELDYTAMLDDRCGTVSRLERFTGAAGIDPTVFERKINEPGARWNPPAGLTAEEAAVFQTSTTNSSAA